ncbi:hypothetical protein S83_005025 [Arachis hypogaea]
MAENFGDVSGDLFRVRCFFFFNTPLRPLSPWQLKKKTTMACRCTSPRSSCSLFAASSSTRYCVSFRVPFRHDSTSPRSCVRRFFFFNMPFISVPSAMVKKTAGNVVGALCHY